MIYFEPYTIAKSEITSTATEAYDSTYFGAAWKGEWSAGTYTDGDIVWEDITIYESATASNTDQPSVGIAKTTPTWIEIGYVNPWRMFDSYVGSDQLAKTSAAGSLEVEITTDQISHIALFNIDADDLGIERINSAGITEWIGIYHILDEALAIYDWYDYFYLPYPAIGRDIIVELDTVLSQALSEKLKITLLKSVGTVSISSCFVGYASYSGQTQWDATVDSYNTGDTTTDSWGRTSFVPGKKYSVVKATIYIEPGNENYVLRNLSELQNKPAIYDFNNDGTEYDILLVYGAITSIGQIFKGVKNSTIDIEIRGIVQKEDI